MDELVRFKDGGNSNVSVPKVINYVDPVRDEEVSGVIDGLLAIVDSIRKATKATNDLN